jgi:alcohol-forming fatty acyl-CoA reductase
VLGTLRAIEFSKQLKNFSAFVYVSTAFCNSNYNKTGIILEKLYKPDYDPYEMMKLVEQSNTPLPDTDSEELKVFLKEHPNTYTFSKQLAENLLAKEMEGYAVGIIRPSVGECKI